VTVADVCAAGMERRAALMALGEETRFAGRGEGEGGGPRTRGVAGDATTDGRTVHQKMWTPTLTS
jgi:hypothetical protein